MLRWLAPALVAALPALACSQCPAHCSGVEYTPISGLVVDDSNGHPIPGATVHYRGDADLSEGDPGRGVPQVMNPTSMQGEVTTADDGTYQLPPLPPGEFTVRVSAPGYFGSRKSMEEQPVGLNQGSRASIHEHLCMATTGKPICGILTDTPDGQFRLQPDPLHLQTMSAPAMAAFALPRESGNRNIYRAAWSPDGNRLGFMSLDSTIRDGSMKWRCIVWTYDLTSGSLTQNDLPGSPGFLTRRQAQQSQPPCPGFDWTMSPQNYSGLHPIWIGNVFYLFRPRFTFTPRVAVAGVEAYAIQNGKLRSVPAPDLPAEIQTAIEIAGRLGPFPMEPQGGERTRDGRYAVEWVPDDATCGALVATTVQTKRKQRLASGCIGLLDFQFLLDRARDIVIYTLPLQGFNSRNDFEELGVFDLGTGRAQTYDLPVLKEGPQFMGYTDLDSGAIRVAYKIAGDCDYATSDYSQPGEPDGALGYTPNQNSVCFITIPPAASPASQLRSP